MSQRYLRSVNIAHDYSQYGHELEGYMATPLVWQTLQRIVQGLQDARQGRAFSIIGPYGTGKSAFGVFLAHWMAADVPRREGLRQRHTTTMATCDSQHVRMLPIAVQVKSGSLRSAVVALLYQQLDLYGIDAHIPLMQELAQQRQNVDVSAEQVADYVIRVSRIVHEHGEFAGIVLMIDELGQHLAHIHRTGDVRDLFVLQTIAEAAARSAEAPVLVVTILHQTFEQYNTTASVTQQAEWAKVQGRFVDLVFQEPQSQMIRFVAQVLKAMPHPKASPKVTQQLAQIADERGVRPADIALNEWRQLVADSYPLHPVVLVALPLLFRQLAQNERSLFAFLTAQERGGFLEVMAQAQPHHLYRVHDLFAYVEHTLGPSLYGRARGRVWLEVSEAAMRHQHAEVLQQHVVLTVGVLAALGDDRLLRPSTELVAWAIGDTEADTLAMLRQLQQAQVLIFSQYRQRWRLAEASDINLDEKYALLRNEIAAQRDIVPLLKQYVQLDPVIAYQHAYYSGTLRLFDVQFVAGTQLIAQHNTTQHNTTQHNTTQHNTTQHNTTQHGRW